MCHPPIGGYSLPEKAYRLKVAQVGNVGWWLLASFALWITLSAGWRAVDDMHSSRVFQVLNHSLIHQIQLPVADAWLVTDLKWRTACTLIINIITTPSLSQRPVAFFVRILQRSSWEPDSSFYCLFVILYTFFFFVQSEELKVCIGSLHVEAFFFFSSLSHMWKMDMCDMCLVSYRLKNPTIQLFSVCLTAGKNVECCGTAFKNSR